MTAEIRRTAHDSGDGATVRHCPFCGGGQVVGRSDGTIECEFDGTAFTVQVQPIYSGFPQTDANGMPIPIPGMPGQIGGPPLAEPGLEGEEDGNPFAEDADGQDAPPGAEDGAPFPPGGDEPLGEDDGDDDEGAPPPAKPKADKPKPSKKTSASLYATASGARLSEQAFTKHLAIRHASPAELEPLLARFRQGG